MIGRIKGLIIEKHPPQVLLETHGIGYEVQLPMTCFYTLPDIGEEAVILIHCVMRDNAQLLFGFIHQQERLLFRELIKVNGIGPKLALMILSGMSAQNFVNAVKNQEINELIRLPGVGKKTAERLVLEMKDRLTGLSDNMYALLLHSAGDSDDMPPAIDAVHLTHPDREAVAALVALGYKPQEASYMVSKIASAGADCETLIRDALRTTL